MNDLAATIQRARRLWHTRRGRALVQVEADLERDCIELQALIGSPLSTSQFQAIVVEVACQSTHLNHTVPKHLCSLLKDKWRREDEPQQFRDQWLPFECGENCLSKFLALLEKKQHKQRQH